jgi:hypothetical protein
MHLPPVIEPTLYRKNNKDLAALDDAQLRAHYYKHGMEEGRVANSLRSRTDFASLISPELRALEIGPFAAPLLHGSNIRYCDVKNQHSLKERAQKLELDASKVPRIHYVLHDMDMKTIPDRFDAVLSSHSIEHQPDLISHLRDVDALLENKDGRYFLLVPDKRFCFDRFLAPTTVAEVIDAHENGQKAHSLCSVIKHFAMITHNRPAQHWQEALEQKAPEINPQRIKAAISTWKNAKGSYIDVHAWYFTPTSFQEIIVMLRKLNYITFYVERLYPTRRNFNEFWAVLSKQPKEDSLPGNPSIFHRAQK